MPQSPFATTRQAGRYRFATVELESESFVVLGEQMVNYLRYRSAEWLHAGPVRLRAFGTFRPSIVPKLVNSKTQIVLEGYPRSANSYAFTAFWISNGQEVPVAHHLHSPVNVELGVSRGLPTVVLVRDPMDAVASLLFRAHGMSPRCGLGRYIRFHERVVELLDHVLVAPFELVVSDFGSVIMEVNRRFDTNFAVYERTPGNEARIRHEIEWSQYVDSGHRSIAENAVPRPSQERKQIKPAVTALIAARKSQLAAARALYEQMMVAALEAVSGN